jgi:two-component system sensor histidine kinase/response regulator
MDAYLSKPLQSEDLFTAIRNLFGEETESIKPLSRPQSMETEDFDRERTLEGMDGDMELLREIVGMFMEEYPGTMKEIKSAIPAGDAHRLNRSAHALKGLVGNFGARPAYELALRLEMMGKNKKLNGAAEVFETLEKEMERLKDALAEFAAKSGR